MDQKKVHKEKKLIRKQGEHYQQQTSSFFNSTNSTCIHLSHKAFEALVLFFVPFAASIVDEIIRGTLVHLFGP
jgi:hypothetical protein